MIYDRIKEVMGESCDVSTDSPKNVPGWRTGSLVASSNSSKRMNQTNDVSRQKLTLHSEFIPGRVFSVFYSILE